MSLISTYLQDMRSTLPSNFDSQASRVVRTGLLTSVLEMTNGADSLLSTQQKELARNSEGRVLELPVLRAGDVTIKTQRTCDIQCGQSTSDLVPITWKTAVVDLCMVPSQYVNNQIGYQEDFNKKMRKRVEALRMAMEEDIDSNIDTAKTANYESTIVTDKYTLAGNAIQVQAAQRELFFNDIDAINYADEFYTDQVYIIANTSMMSDVNHYIHQGPSNDENLTYQFAGKQFMFTNRIENRAGVVATGYFMPAGSIALLTRIAIDARLNHTSTRGTEWSVENIPGLPFAVGVMYYSECSDQSALEANGLEHLTATLVEHWQISYDYAIVMPYVEDAATDATAIRKFEFLA